MTCPHLEYRTDGDGQSFDTPRAYCGVTASFVQPMRADVCNDRYDLHHAAHCEVFLEHEAADGGADGAQPETQERTGGGPDGEGEES
ncbi:hypothetical protein [Halobacterium bonnevillei]|uniref:Uncharacterized protein n=1 Tax=Halobacterium bonnevillei TaxID=2692200 RepID=A0A6B0SLW9_9EURY|nr:hypothetical protein [Halobacterium bonnevillei]MXR19942.1 hypothetical protein [Halobacterium bonnevillei]